MATVTIPDVFAPEYAKASAGEREDLALATCKLLASGTEVHLVMERVADAGWSPGFARWYVGLADANRNHLLLLLPGQRVPYQPKWLASVAGLIALNVIVFAFTGRTSIVLTGMALIGAVTGIAEYRSNSRRSRVPHDNLRG